MKVTDHKRSILLTPDENDLILSLIKTRQLSLCTTVVQIFKTEAPFHTEWKLLNTAVLCLIKDNRRKSFYFKAYTFDRCIWEEELYMNMEYIRNKLYFHSFEASNNMIGFNFAHLSEAEDFYVNVQRKIANLSRTKAVLTKAKSMRRKLSKVHIGTPTGFAHVQHVGFGPEQGFKLQLTSTEFISFFDKSGLDSSSIETPRTRKVINSFVEAFGEDKIREAISATSPTSPPPRTCSNASTSPRQKGNTLHGLAPFPPPLPARNVLKDSFEPAYGAPAPTVPSPPAPPPLLHEQLPILPPREPKFSIPSPTSNSERLAPLPLPPMQPKEIPFVDDGRSNLLESIRRGTKLKPAVERKLNELPIHHDEESSVLDIRHALQEALTKRSNAINADDSSDESTSSTDSDAWD